MARAPFGVGFITWSLAKQPELLDVALNARPRAIMLSFGDPKPFASRIKAAGALLICQVQSEDMAQAALDAGADILVAQGTEAGGHGASRTTIDIVPAIIDLAAGRVPVVAAGGIGDGRGLAAMMTLGAAGVLLGTRFYASQEADGAEEAKKRICAATGGSTTRGIIFDLSRNNVWPAPFNGRCLINDHARRWTGREVELLQNVNTVAAEYAAAKAAGNFDIAAVIAGEAVGLIHDIPPAAEIVDRIVAEARPDPSWAAQFRHGFTPNSQHFRNTRPNLKEQTMWPDRRLLDLFKTEFPIVLAPMAGVMDADLVIAAAQGGALGSLPCAMLSVEKAREQVNIIRQRVSAPVNMNFFCHKAGRRRPGARGRMEEAACALL